MKEPIQDYSHRTLGYIETKPNGDKIATDYAGRTLGYYKKAQNITTDYCGRTLYYGDMVATFIR